MLRFERCGTCRWWLSRTSGDYYCFGSCHAEEEDGLHYRMNQFRNETSWKDGCEFWERRANAEEDAE